MLLSFNIDMVLQKLTKWKLSSSARPDNAPTSLLKESRTLPGPVILFIKTALV